MMCPQCGKRPLTFSQFARTMNPFRIQCRSCGAELKAGLLAYVWTLLHAPLAIGLVALRSVLGFWFLPVAIAVVFCTAFAIPYFGFNNLYRLRSPAA